MQETKFNLKSRESKNDMLFVLKELHLRKKLTEKEYYRAVTIIQNGEY